MTAIKVENLSKCYRVVHNQQRGGYRTLRDSIADAVKAPYRRLMNGGQADAAEDFWALKDVSFEVQPGEVIGIIGRNGAGKSTLLKILSRITKPTEGRVELNGRVGSLLEVGTGFHPELTGRENIYLNGSILGMKREEIDRKFDEIVAFAEIEKFLDTPVKRYSSGMYVRLAFAVSAHLETDILLVDEVLAVGDAEFQQKCLGKMSQVGRDGRTVFFVSHNMVAVQNLCRRVIILKDGRLWDDDDSDQSISKYLKAGAREAGSLDLRSCSLRPPGGRPFFSALEIYDEFGQCTAQLRAGSEVSFRVKYEWPEPLLDPRVSISLSSMTGTRLLTLCTRWNNGLLGKVSPRGEMVCRVPELMLMPGKYVISLACGTGNDAIEVLDGVASFTVEQRDIFGTGQFPKLTDGLFLTKANWDIRS